MADDIADLRRELDRLRRENARLSRLLALRGGETEPPPEQLILPVSHPGLVTMASPVSTKLALYTDRFRCRTDIYATRWENSHSGRSGWVPAVAGGWRKGMDRRHARYLSLTQEVLAAHLSGDVFIGLYPLLADNSCQFLVADFDGSTAMLDALAYVKAAGAAGVPTGLELSQSGRGAHAWVFFSGPVPAAIARELGTALVREAILLRGALDLRAYDRLFPSQDGVPDGGFGNLIAAPLQGQRRKDGLTLFLDLATLEPHEDQWEFLSTLDRLHPNEAERIAHRLSRPALSSEVRTLARSTATKVQPQLATVVRAELGAGLSIATDQLPPAALATFTHAASIANPKFYEMQRLRKSTWNTPRFVRGYDLTVDDRLVLPRGLRHSINEIVGQAGSRLEVTDTRSTGDEIHLALRTELSVQQSAAVSEMLGHDDGVLVAPPGSGKTVMACALIAERGVSTLVLVDRKMLAEQWRDRVDSFLGVRPGQLGGGRKKLTGIVDIAMLPTLARRGDVAELTARYGHVIVDECHHLAAAAYDHSVKPISAHLWLGLTATPERRDGLDDLVTWQLGPIRHTIGADPDRGTLWAVEPADHGPRRELLLHETAFRGGDVDPAEPGSIAAIHAALAGDPERNDQIVDDVVAAAARGRNCLVLTRRVAHVEALAVALEGRGRHPLILQGGMTVTQRREVMAQLGNVAAGEGALVIGTTPFIGEGFDVPALDTLFLAGPISFDGLLVQCVGRVVRAAAGKTSAEVHDYHDVETPVLAASLRKRIPGYRRLGFDQL